jgi:hypothetical protein
MFMKKIIHSDLFSLASPKGAIIDTNGAQEECS